MNATLDSPFRNVGWTNVADASGPILRTAVSGAIVTQPRLELSYDFERSEYELGMTSNASAALA